MYVYRLRKPTPRRPEPRRYALSLVFSGITTTPVVTTIILARAFGGDDLGLFSRKRGGDDGGLMLARGADDAGIISRRRGSDDSSE